VNRFEETTTPLAPGTHTITVEGIAQRYHVAGTGPVCVAHSGGPGIAWPYLKSEALEQHLTMVYLEPIGTGDSGRLADPSGYHLDTYTRFLHAVVEHLGVPKVALLGHSHGGFVVLRHVLEHADRVSGIVLYDTSPVTGEEFWADAVANVTRFAERHQAPEVAAAFARIGSDLDDDGKTQLVKDLLPSYFADYHGREAEFRPLRDGLRAYRAPDLGVEPRPFDVREQLPEITVPTLVVVGAHDVICGPRWAELLINGIPHAQALALTDSGHFGHLEQPEEFESAVVDLVTKAAAH